MKRPRYSPGGRTGGTTARGVPAKTTGFYSRARVPASRGRSAAGLLALSLLLWGVTACRSGPAESHGREAVLRFIDPDPQTLLHPGRLSGAGAATEVPAMIANGTKVTLDDEVRNALPALPGLPVERRLEVPREARFRFSYGAPATAPLPLRFVVVADPDDGDAITLFEATLAAGTDLDRWHREEIDLSPLAGRKVRLELSVDSGTPVELREGMPAWGNPEVWAPRHRRPPPNVVLVSIDTLRSDRMSLYGHPRPTTPHLDAWARDSATVFSSAVAQAPWTVPSHVSMFTGLDAHRNADLLPYARKSARLTPVAQIESAQASLHLLAERLRDVGFSTLAVTGGGYLHPRYGFSQGFDRYRYFGGRRDRSEDELQVGIESALEWLAEYSERPFFLFFHTYEVHGPWLAREPYFSQFSDVPLAGDRIRNAIPLRRGGEEGFRWTRPFSVDTPPGVDGEELFKAVYDSGVAYTDRHLHRLFQGLAEGGLDQRTIVVVTSDHGHLIGEHGLIGHHYLYDENLLVPLVISGPRGRGAGRRVSRQVRLVDIVPTVLELAGLPPPEEGLDGESLVPLMDGRAEGAPGDEAWTYASRPNRGLSVRMRNELKYVFNNAAWSPLQGREEAFRVGEAGEEEIPVSRVPEIESLRRRVRRALAETPGLRMRLQADASASFSGTIRGPLVQQNTVKSSDPACDCMRWVADGEAAFEAPPGRTVTFNFEHPGSREFVLALAAEGEDGTAVFEQTIDAGALDERLFVTWTPSGWRLGRGQPPRGGASVAFWWVGKRPLNDSPEAAPDPDLRARLEALGYLD